MYWKLDIQSRVAKLGGVEPVPVPILEKIRSEPCPQKTTQIKYGSKYNWYISTFYISTVCPGSSDLFYIVSYYIKWVTTSWTHSVMKENLDFKGILTLGV